MDNQSNFFDLQTDLTDYTSAKEFVEDIPLPTEPQSTDESASTDRASMTSNRQQRLLRRRRRKLKRWSTFVLPIALFYIEWVFHFVGKVGDFKPSLLLFLPVFSLLFGSLFSGIFCCFSDKVNRILTAVFLGFWALIASVQVVYKLIFRALFRWSMLGLAGAAVADFGKNAIMPIITSLFGIVLLFLPLILFLVFQKKWYLPAQKHTGPQVLAFFLSLVMLLTSVLGILPSKSRRHAFFVETNSNPDATLQHYGLVAETTLDFWYAIFGAPKEDVGQYVGLDGKVDAASRVDEEGKSYAAQTLNIDFDRLKEAAPNKTIRDMHEYFANKQPTFENDYTGMFKGKNLIFLTLEGFSGKVIDPEFTPTLYKMSQEGFRFTNFYDSVWGGSTATGEYSNMTGNFYNSATCLELSGGTLTYSAFGNLFRSQGYDTYAYHNHTYTYYSRNLSHPNFGYDYKGIGKGMTLPKIVWPNSDLEMAQATASEYINRTDKSKPFHAYYMTVSGHANYTFVGNSMSTRHRDDLPAKYDHYSDNVKAYIACQYEVELMLQDLVKQLDEAGILKDTVFAMCCDHYPYALSDSELAELYGLSQSGLRDNLDLYRNSFVLWSASMEKPITVDVPCSSVDMVPTLCNLFGLKYDSRIITGKDILSDCEHIAILNTESTWWNWISEKGIYTVSNKKFTPADGVEMTQEEIDSYVDLTCKKVSGMRAASFGILDNDYYKYVFNKDFSLKFEKTSDASAEPAAPENSDENTDTP
ncbi:MAG: LTA synthase family protein [Clostridia bacterium]|nr:LTA synthase family protein [Clostridia bacterium]